MKKAYPVILTQEKNILSSISLILKSIRKERISLMQSKWHAMQSALSVLIWKMNAKHSQRPPRFPLSPLPLLLISLPLSMLTLPNTAARTIYVLSAKTAPFPLGSVMKPKKPESIFLPSLPQLSNRNFTSLPPLKQGRVAEMKSAARPFMRRPKEYVADRLWKNKRLGKEKGMAKQTLG